MVSKYSKLTEEQKEKRREAHRKWAAKVSRKSYYKAYDEARSNKAERAEKFREFRHKNPEYWRKYSNEAYHRNKNNERPSTTKEYRLWWNARKRATAKGLEFSLERSDVIIPDICPCCETAMERPSMDRLIPDKGYTKENSLVICYRCNVIKSFGSAEDHRMIADFIDKYTT